MGNLFALHLVCSGALALVHRHRNPQVHLLPLPSQQRVVRGVPDQRVLERVASLRAEPALMHETRLHEAAQLTLQRVLALGSDGGQQFPRERAPDHRGELRDLLGRADAIEPRGQRITQRGWQLPPFPRVAPVEHRARHFFHEQRNAVGLRRDLLAQPGRHRPIAHHELNQLSGFRAAERAERQLRHAGVRAPGHVHGIEADGHDEQQRRRGRLIDEPLEPRQGRRVEPMEIFDHEDNGFALGHFEQQRHQRFERLLALPLGRHGWQRRLIGR